MGTTAKTSTARRLRARSRRLGLDSASAHPTFASRRRQGAQLLVVRDPVGGALDDDVEPALPLVAAGRQDHVRVVLEVAGFLLVGPVQK